jgi:hypothetical protein
MVIEPIHSLLSLCAPNSGQLVLNKRLSDIIIGVDKQTSELFAGEEETRHI